MLPALERHAGSRSNHHHHQVREERTVRLCASRIVTVTHPSKVPEWDIFCLFIEEFAPIPDGFSANDTTTYRCSQIRRPLLVLYPPPIDTCAEKVKLSNQNMDLQDTSSIDRAKVTSPLVMTYRVYLDARTSGVLHNERLCTIAVSRMHRCPMTHSARQGLRVIPTF